MADLALLMVVAAFFALAAGAVRAAESIVASERPAGGSGVAHKPSTDAAGQGQ